MGVGVLALLPKDRTMTVAAVVESDVLRDKSYQRTAIGSDIVAWLRWLEVSQRRPRTLDQYERDVAKAALMYEDLPLRKWTDRQLLEVVRSWPAPSRKTRKAALDSFFAWALLTRRINRNPTAFLPKIKQRPRKHIETFTHAETDDLLALTDRDAVLMAILLGAGLRKDEAINLQVRRLRVGQEPASIVVIGGKGDKDRAVHPLPEMAEIMAEFLLHNQLEPQDYLWYHKPGGGNKIVRNEPLSSTSFARWWADCLDKAGVKYRNPHTARHTFATEWLRRGGRLEVLSGELGHESIKTTFDTYAHLDERDLLIDLAVIGENRPERSTRDAG